MPVKKLKEFLDANSISFKSIEHAPTFTASRTAQTTHIKGKKMAKTVMVKIDGKMAMAVVSANDHADLEKLKVGAGAESVELANENEFKALFPECDVGAMPPFGNLYDMDVFVDEVISRDDEIAFNAGTHTEVIQLAYKDFESHVHPTIANLVE